MRQDDQEECGKAISEEPSEKSKRCPFFVFPLIVLLVVAAIVIGVVFSLTATRGNGGSGNDDNDKNVIPTVSPTLSPIAPTEAAGGGLCCFFSPTDDPCNDCTSGETTGFCAESRDNCEVSCGSGTFCVAGEASPTARPSAATAGPTSSLSPRNVFAQVDGNFYVNPTYAANLDATISGTTDDVVAANLERMKSVPSAYWIDVKSKIVGTTTSDLRGILIDASSSFDEPPLCVFMLYNLPNRDCAAFASRGEICCAYLEDGTCDYDNSGDCEDGLEEYETTYVDPFVEVLKEFDGIVPMAIVVEPDSLPNFATNLDDPRCGNQGTQLAYTRGISYAVTQISEQTQEVAVYLDAAHGGWLGWEDNLDSFVETVKDLGIESHLRGFATNVANYQGLGEPCPDDVDCRIDLEAQRNNPCCEDPCDLLTQYNRANNEHNYAKLLVDAFQTAIPGFKPHVIIDTGRNGNPSARTDCSTWCNPRDTLVGAWPTPDTLDPDVVDAYYWLKTPGESDGCTEILPSEGDEFVANGTCPRYDRSCAAVDSIGTDPGEPFAPEAGGWFEYQIRMLAATLPPSSTEQGSEHPTPAPVATAGSGGGGGVETNSSSPVERYGALSTAGNKVVGSDGSVVQLVGMSLFWSNSGWEGAPFYTAGVVDALVDEWKCQLVRAAMGVEESTGYIDDAAGNEARVRVVVDAAIARGIYVIVDWHTHHAEDYLDQAKDFFERMAVDYGSYPNVIFEIYNEPIDTAWSNVTDPEATKTIKAYAEEVISVIREKSDNLIVVGTRFYSQFVWEAALDPIDGRNIAYTSHFYAGTHGVWERSLVRKGLLGPEYVPGVGEQAGWTSDENPTAIAVFVTEWGTVDADGGGSVDEDSTREWLEFCDTYGLSHANWALDDKFEGSAALKPGADTTGEWTAADYTDSGAFVKSLLLEYEE